MVGIFLLILLIALGSPATAQEEAQANGLFVDAVARGTVNVPDQATRSRTVAINMDALGGTDGPDLADGGVGQQLSLNLFDNVQLTAQLDNLNRNINDTYSWIGNVADGDKSYALLVVQDGVMAGLVIADGNVYEIRYVADDVHVILEIDQSLFEEHPPEWMEMYNATMQDGTLHALPNNRMAADDGTVIDIMVGYTGDARAVAGGTAAIENTAQLAVDATNLAYTNSNVDQRLYLVHTVEFSYTESGNSSTDLSNWRGKTDGLMDNAHALRDEYHADIMMLLTEDGGGFCGIASLQTTFSASFEASAFGVTARNCAVGNLSFAHEAGHNMGLRHDWYVDDTTSPLGSAAHGFSNAADGWRTVMAYGNYCSAVGTSCTRLPYFSNTAVTYGGDAMGVAAGTNVGCTADSTIPDPNSCDSDNASIMNAGDTTYAQWRTSRITWTGAVSSDWNTAGNWDIVQGTTENGGSTTTVNRVPLSIDDVLIPSSAPNMPVISSGTLNARDVTVENGASLAISGGTINVYGQWLEQGTGQTTSTAGTVNFVGTFDQTITAHADTTFPAVTFGSGDSTQEVSLASDLDIDGDLATQAGAALMAGANTINVSGSWSEGDISGFNAGSGTVIFDGATQTASKPTSITLFNEDFSDANGQSGSYSSGFLPSDWTREHSSGHGWLAGDLGMGGVAFRWNTSSDGWLFTTGANLVSGVTYQLTFQHRNWSSGDENNVSVSIGTAANSASMGTVIHSSPNFASTSFTNNSETFTVPTSGTYYFGIRSEQVVANSRTIIDNFMVTGTRGLVFNDLQVESGTTTFSVDVVVEGDLQTASGTIVDFGANDPTVEGTVTNNGTIRQTKDVSVVGTLVEFGRIQNAAGTTNKYYGVDITPTSAAFGNTTVDIKGNGKCTVSEGTVNNSIDRCYEITPTTNSQPATVRFYYNESEIAGQTYNSLQIWHWNSTATDWDGPIGSPTYGDSTNGDANWNWVEASGISDYSPFSVGNAAPTAIGLDSFNATANPDGSVTLDWETSFELNHSGFNIYRRSANSRTAWIQVNDTLIGSQGSQAQGATYQHVETNVPTGTWEYVLEDVETDGGTLRHTDSSSTVEVGTPTVVTLGSDNVVGAGSVMLLLSLGLALLTVGTFVTRRK